MKRVILILVILLIIGLVSKVSNRYSTRDTEYFDAGFYSFSDMQTISGNVDVYKFDHDSTDAYIRSVIENNIGRDGRNVVSITPFYSQGTNRVRYVYIVYAVKSK